MLMKKLPFKKLWKIYCTHCIIVDDGNIMHIILCILYYYYIIIINIILLKFTRRKSLELHIIESYLDRDDTNIFRPCWERRSIERARLTCA